MVFDDAKRRLESLWQMELVIEHGKRERELLRYDTGIHSIDYGAERVQVNKTAAPSEAVVLRGMELDKEIETRIIMLITLRDQIIQEIHKVDNPTLSQFLFLRYVEKKPLEKIAEEMSYTFGHIRKMSRRAVQAYADMQTDIP